jgi:thymidylate synthase (FAD)
MKIELLDHGYLFQVETWGSDERIIEAARMSTDKGFHGWGPKHADHCIPGMGGNYDDCSCGGKEAGDEKLLNFLYTNKHATPFEFAGLVVEVQAPIFIFREWHRHRTQSYAEMSARYTPLPNFNYIPTVERLLRNSKTNKQAGTIKGADELIQEQAEHYRDALLKMYDSDEEFYQHALKIGVPKELARIHLPVGRYSRMRASANLRNWLAFMTLRSASGAQWEIQVYSRAIGTLVKEAFPRTWDLFVEKGHGV